MGHRKDLRTKMSAVGYYITKKAAPYAFKPYDRKRVRRDLHDARIVSLKLSAAVRRARRDRAANVESQIREACA